MSVYIVSGSERSYVFVCFSLHYLHWQRYYKNASAFKLPSLTFSKQYLASLCTAQHVAHEIVDTSRPGCPPEYMNIHVPERSKGKYDYKFIPFTRSNYHSDSGKSPNTPRAQVKVGQSYPYRIAP